MRPLPSRPNQLDGLATFSEKEEVTQEVTRIQLRPTRLAMPPLPLKDDNVPTSIAALLADTLADEALDDKAEELQEDDELEGPTGVVVQASLPPQVDSHSDDDDDEPWLPPTPMSSPARLVGLPLTVAAFGFAIAFFVTRPSTLTLAAPAEPRSTPVVAARSVVEMPEVSIPAAAASTAPIDSAEPPASNPPPTVADGQWMLRHGQVQRAEVIFRSVLASDGSQYEALTGLGKVSLANHQPSEALAFFERALARQPQYFPARLGRADALWDAGRRDAAKAHYAGIRERYSDNAIPSRVIERTR